MRMPKGFNKWTLQHQEEFVDENLLVSHGAKQLFTEVQGKVLCCSCDTK